MCKMKTNFWSKIFPQLSYTETAFSMRFPKHHISEPAVQQCYGSFKVKTLLQHAVAFLQLSCRRDFNYIRLIKPERLVKKNKLQKLSEKTEVKSKTFPWNF